MLKRYSWFGENKLVNWCNEQDKSRDISKLFIGSYYKSRIFSLRRVKWKKKSLLVKNFVKILTTKFEICCRIRWTTNSLSEEKKIQSESGTDLVNPSISEDIKIFLCNLAFWSRGQNPRRIDDLWTKKMGFRTRLKIYLMSWQIS